jgi:hypothetical protein
LEFEINVEQAESHVQTDLSLCLTFDKNFSYLALVADLGFTFFVVVSEIKTNLGNAVKMMFPPSSMIVQTSESQTVTVQPAKEVL